MSVYRVDRAELPAFVQRLSQQQRGAALEISFGEPDRLNRAPGRTRARKGRLLELRLREYGRHEILEVELATPDGKAILIVRSPSRAILEQPGESSPAEVRFEAIEPPSIVLRFAEPAVPGELDRL